VSISPASNDVYETLPDLDHRVSLSYGPLLQHIRSLGNQPKSPRLKLGSVHYVSFSHKTLGRGKHDNPSVACLNDPLGHYRLERELIFLSELVTPILARVEKHEPILPSDDGDPLWSVQLGHKVEAGDQSVIEKMARNLQVDLLLRWEVGEHFEKHLGFQ
jgi:hypothetical protein